MRFSRVLSGLMTIAFAPDGGAGGGGAAGGQGGGATGATGGGAAGGTGQGGDQGNGDAGGGAGGITQDQLTKIATKEKQEGHRAGRNEYERDLLKRYGVASIEELDTKLKGDGTPPPTGKEKPAAGQGDEVWRQKEQGYQTQVQEANKRAEQATESLQKREKELFISGIAEGLKVRADAKSIVAETLAGHFTYDEAGKLVLNEAVTGVKFNAKGEKMSPDEYVKDFLATRPFFLEPSGTNGAGSGTTTGGTGAGGKFTKAQIEAMTPDQINANWAAISKQMAEGPIT
jgi:hypothetical protein